MAKIKSFEEACKALKLDPAKVVPEGLTADEQAYIKLKVITKALNGKWQPNWKNSSDYKYWPFFYLGDGGFSYYDCDYWLAITIASSRLCFKSSALAEYAGQTFTDLYKDYLTIQ